MPQVSKFLGYGAWPRQQHTGQEVGVGQYHSWDQTGWILTFRDSDAVLIGLGAGEQGGGTHAWRQQVKVENPVPE